MKILLVSLYLVEYAIELANALATNNRVHLLLTQKRVAQTVGDCIDDKIDDNVSYSLLPYCALRHPDTIKCLSAITKLCFNFRPDIIHVQENNNPLNFIFFLLSFKPVVTTVHDVQMHPGEAAISAKPWKLWLIGKIRKHTYNKIIVHGKNLKKEFLHCHKRPSQDVFVIPHGSLFSFRNDSITRAIREPHSILFFGRIQEYKGLRYLIEAEPLISKTLPSFKIIIAGKGSDLSNYKSLISFNSHYEIHDRFIPNVEVAAFFQRATAVVLPYIQASQSGIIAMAFAFGKPVIVSDVGSLSEMVANGITGLVVPPKKPKALSEAILNLLTDPKKVSRFSQNAHEAAMKDLSWDHIADLTREVYQKAVWGA